MSIRDIAEPVSLNDGTAMPGYGFGCYAAHGEEIINAIRWAVRDGYRYIDSAAMYGNEAEVGEAIRTCGVQREDLFISSKIWPTRFDDPDASLAQSLRDLGIDALDCCLLHWPGTDRKQRLSAYEKLLRRREEGFVRRIGVSNFQIEHLEEIRSAFGRFPVLNQIELHPLYQERALCAYCRENGIRLVAWGPLFRGKLMQHPAIVEIAAAHGKTPGQVILRWHIQKGHIAIPKSSNESRIHENGDVFSFILTPDDMDRIDALDCGEHIGDDPYTFTGIK